MFFLLGWHFSHPVSVPDLKNSGWMENRGLPCFRGFCSPRLCFLTERISGQAGRNTDCRSDGGPSSGPWRSGATGTTRWTLFVGCPRPGWGLDAIRTEKGKTKRKRKKVTNALSPGDPRSVFSEAGDIHAYSLNFRQSLGCAQ